MSELLIKSVQDLNEAVVALRLKNEQKDGESKQAVEKIQLALDKYEEKNQELVKALQIKENQIKEIEGKLIDLTSAKNFNVDNSEQQAEVKAFENFLVNGKSLPENDLKYLRTDVFQAGGVFVPEIRLQGILKNIVEKSDLRPFATVRTMGSKTESMAIRTGSVVAYMTGEGEQTTQSQASYGDLKLEAKKMTAQAEISYEALQDSSADLIAEMNSEVAEQFAQKEGQQLINGSGAGNNLLGLMSHPDITSINSGDASNLTFDSLIRVTGEIKTGYNPIYAFNRKTLAELRLLKIDNKYVWEAGNLGVGAPSDINGSRYVIMPDMPDIGAGTYPIIYGDFKNLVIGDRKALTVIRDESTLGNQNIIRYYFHRRIGSVITKPEAFKKIKISN